MDNPLTLLIRLLNECAVACNHCASACLEEEDVKMMARCIALDLDCADLCTAAARLLARDSDYADGLLDTCAKACNACADECDRHGDHHEHCRICAEACRRCAEACASYTG